jgi:hypothetical protein
MPFDFPTTPTAGTVHAGYVWDGEKWVGGLPADTDAPNDGAQYVRQSAMWAKTDGPVKISNGVAVGNLSNVDIALPTGFHTFELSLAGITTTGAGQLAARFSADGSTFAIAGYAHGGNVLAFPTAANNPYGLASASEILITSTLLSADTNRGVARLTIPVVTASNQLQHMLIQSTCLISAGVYGMLNGMGVSPFAGQPAAIRLFMTASALIASGARWQLNGWR